jgi:hypothetical protein
MDEYLNNPQKLQAVISLFSPLVALLSLGFNVWLGTRLYRQRDASNRAFNVEKDLYKMAVIDRASDIILFSTNVYGKFQKLTKEPEINKAIQEQYLSEIEQLRDDLDTQIMPIIGVYDSTMQKTLMAITEKFHDNTTLLFAQDNMNSIVIPTLTRKILHEKKDFESGVYEAIRKYMPK